MNALFSVTLVKPDESDGPAKADKLKIDVTLGESKWTYVVPERGLRDLDKYAHWILDWNSQGPGEWIWKGIADGELKTRAPRPASVVSKLLLNPDAPYIGPIANWLETDTSNKIVYLHITGQPDDVRYLHLLPWEMAKIAPRNLNGHPTSLLRSDCEVVRILDQGQAPSNAERPKELAYALFSSPLYREQQGDVEAFNAEPIARLVKQSTSLGFLEKETLQVHTEDPSWESFKNYDAVAKVFFGHGESREGGGDHLCFFDGQGTDWEPKKVTGASLTSHYSARRQSERLLALFACDSYRVIAAALTPHGGHSFRPPPSILATLTKIPMSHMARSLPHALAALCEHNDVLAMIRKLRQLCRDDTPVKHLHDAFVLFHAPGSDALKKLPKTSRIPIFDGSTALIPWTRTFLGLKDSCKHHEHLHVHAQDLGLPSNTRTPQDFEALGFPPARTESETLGPIEISKWCVTRWQLYRVQKDGTSQRYKSNDVSPELQKLPAIVDLSTAMAFASSVGGRLPTPDEWELCVTGPIKFRTTASILFRKSIRDLATQQVLGPFKPSGMTKGALPMKHLVPVDWEGPEPKNPYQLKLMLGNIEEWALDRNGVSYAMGGRFDEPIGLCLPQRRLKVDPAKEISFRVVWD